MDYNWFLSATAQSTAAIIAIFSAFIITKIINNQKKYSENLSLFNTFDIESKKLNDLNNIRINTHSDRTREARLIEKAKLDIRIDYHINRLNDFISSVSLNPESSSLITFSIISLLILFFIGVILPLYMLTYFQEVKVILINFIISFENFQIILLLIISIIFTTIMIVFFIINLTMKYDKNKIEEMKKYLKPAYYSQ